MAKVSMQNVKELRERTQAGLNDCKSALEESDGDMDKAVEILQKKGQAKVAKRAGAVAGEGLVISRVAQDRKSGVLVEVNIQTDFAARSEDFVGFAHKVADIAETAPEGADLGTLPFPSGGTLEEARQALVGKLGENVIVRRWERLKVDGSGLVHAYVHMGGKIGALLAVATGSDEAAKKPELEKFADDTAMQIAAMPDTRWLSKGEVPEPAKLKQAEIFEAQFAVDPKAPPPERRAGAVQGKVGKWLKEVVLLEQQSVIETDKTVEQVRAEVAQTVGSDVKILRFVRYERGEGIEKPQGPDFASEVSKMAGG